MSQFDDLMNAGFAETLAQIPTTFIFRGETYVDGGIYSDLAESFDLGDGGFQQTIVAMLMIPFISGIEEDPKHDEKITINFLKPAPKSLTFKIGRPVQKDEISWTLNLISAR